MKERQLDISIGEGKNLFRPLKPIRIGTSGYNPTKSAFRTVSTQCVRDLKPKHFSGKKDLENNVENHGISATGYTNYNVASLDTNKTTGADNFNNKYNKADLAIVSDILSDTDLTIAKDQCNIRNTGVARPDHCFTDKAQIGVIEDCVLLDGISDSDKNLVQSTTRKDDVDLKRFSHARDTNASYVLCGRNSMEEEKKEEHNSCDSSKQEQETSISVGHQDSSDMKQEGFRTMAEDNQVIFNRSGNESAGDLIMGKPCINTSTENCKDKSDGSDSSELLNDNSTCQLTNQTLSSKTLSSGNPSLERDSKLRVSVFDHRIIPKRFTNGRINLNRIIDNGGSDIEGEECNSQTCYNDNEIKNGKRKGLQLSYAQLKRRNNLSSDSSKDSSPDMDKGSFRTQFDVLLRSLIGDVNDMQVDSSPMTISSGYESDYIQTKEADIDDIFKKNKESRDNVIKVNVNTKKQEDNPTDYFSMSEKSELSPPARLGIINTETKPTHGLRTAFSSMPCFPTPQDTDLVQKPKSKEAPVLRSMSQDNDSNEFSYAQRHNYKLTKVTRSMYEIIHDLQNGEKAPSDNRRRSRKGRRGVQEGSANTDGNTSAKEIKSRGRLQSTELLSNNNVDTSSLNRNKPNISGSVVRCVRRPLANDSSFQPVPRMPPRGEGNQRAGSSSGNNNSDKVQNDLRNLLCSTSDVPLSSGDNNTHFEQFNGFSRMDNKQDSFKAVIANNSENRFIQSDFSINHDPNIIGQDGQRRLTLNEQFIHRPKPDEHVYETIPGDEKLYEEWKRMRATSTVPKIRRFTTVPDLPGTFVPKEPPALPERRYLNSSSSVSKDSENQNYIFMGDINSNIVPKPNSERSDSGYASVASDKMLDSRTLQCNSHPLHVEPVIHHRYRSDEASDGYCSIDNISLCPETLASSLSYPGYPTSSLDRRLPPTSNRFPLPRNNRNDYFTNPVLSRHSNSRHSNSSFSRFDNGAELSSRPSRFATRFFDNWKLDGSDSDQTMSSAFDRDTGKQVVQGTYV